MGIRLNLHDKEDFHASKNASLRFSESSTLQQSNSQQPNKHSKSKRSTRRKTICRIQKFRVLVPIWAWQVVYPMIPRVYLHRRWCIHRTGPVVKNIHRCPPSSIEKPLRVDFVWFCHWFVSESAGDEVPFFLGGGVLSIFLCCFTPILFWKWSIKNEHVFQLGWWKTTN